MGSRLRVPADATRLPDRGSITDLGLPPDSAVGFDSGAGDSAASPDAAPPCPGFPPSGDPCVTTTGELRACYRFDNDVSDAQNSIPDSPYF